MFRSSQQRPSRVVWWTRWIGRSRRSSSARLTRRSSSWPKRDRPRQTDATSRSIRLGAASCSPRSRSRTRSPSGPSSMSATARTLASMTSTVAPQSFHRVRQGQRSSGSAAGSCQDLVDGGLGGLGNQLGAEIFLQRLMCGQGALPQDCMRLLGNVLDLNVRHGAIMAPMAPKWKLCGAVHHTIHRALVPQAFYSTSVGGVSRSANPVSRTSRLRWGML